MKVHLEDETETGIVVIESKKILEDFTKKDIVRIVHTDLNKKYGKIYGDRVVLPNIDDASITYSRMVIGNVLDEKEIDGYCHGDG